MTIYKTSFMPSPTLQAEKPAYKPPPPPKPPPPAAKAPVAQSSFQPAPTSRPKVDLSGGSPATATSLRTELSRVLNLPPGAERNAEIRRLGLDPVANVMVADSPAQQLASARTELTAAIEALPDPLTAEAWDRVQNAAAAYEQAMEDIYGVTLDQTPAEGAGYQTPWLDLSGWEPPAIGTYAAQTLGNNTLALLSNFDTGMQQTADYLATVTGNTDPYAAFQEVMGPVNYRLVDPLPDGVTGAKGYTDGQDVYFRIGPGMPAPMTSDLVIHELGHVLMYRAGNGNGANSPLQQDLGNEKRLNQAGNWMDAAARRGGEDAVREHDEATATETGADLFLFYVRGWLPSTSFNGTMRETIDAASGN